MFNKLKKPTNLFLIFFILHGWMYYIFPDQHYKNAGENTGWIAYIKYICIPAIILSLTSTRFPRVYLPWLTTGGFIVLIPFGLYIYWLDDANLLILNFTFPISAYFLATHYLKNQPESEPSSTTLFIFILTTLIAVTLEIFFSHLITGFSSSGFRAVGPFVNPNNTGILIALSASSIHFLRNTKTLNLLTFLVATPIIIATGSKTALAIYILGIVLSPGFFLKISIITSASILSAFFFEQISNLWLSLELRSISLESGEIRKDDANTFIKNFANSDINEIIFGSSNTSIVDNAYLDILSFGGLVLLLFFIIIQLLSILVSIKKKLYFILFLHALLFVAMLTTNIPRLWPTAYIYWSLIGITTFIWFSKNSTYKSSSTKQIHYV